MDEDDWERPYTPTPRVNRPRCKACGRILYWDGFASSGKGRWVCKHDHCGKVYARRTVE